MRYLEKEGSRSSIEGARAASSAAESGQYRPDVDGLRAVAIIGVVIFHSAPNLLPGGFAGVDVFFVISGFLISGIILRELERGRFSILTFCARRAKRIFPALITMLITVSVLAWPVFLWDEYQRLGKHMIAGAGFALNLVLYSDFNLYFGVTTSPLIHLWSLGVEEQFYFLWPVFLLSVWAWTKGRWRLVVIAMLALASFALNVMAVAADPTASFYLPSSRIWELAMGGALAYVGFAKLTPGYIDPPRRIAWLGKHARGIVGATLIVLAFCILNSGLAFPGWWALAPCTGAVLLISAGPHSWVNRYVLSSRPMVMIGLISYPLYLWHWPLLSIVRIAEGNQPEWILGAVAIAVILSFLTYNYIERPIRHSSNKAELPVALCASMLVCGILGYMMSIRYIPARSESYHLDRFIRATREDWFSTAKTDWTWDSGSEFLSLGQGPREIVFIGDSNMQQYYPRVARLLEGQLSTERRATFAVKPGCAPAVIELLKGMNAHFVADCRNLLSKALAYAETPRVDTVVIAAYWRGYTLAGATNIADFSVHGVNPDTDAALEQLERIVANLEDRGKRVYIVLNIPTSPYFDPRGMVHRRLGAPAFSVEVHTPTRAEVEQTIGPVTSKLRMIGQRTGARVIDPMDTLCTATVCSPVTPAGEPIYHDFGHLRPSYVRDHVQFLDDAILESQVVADGHTE